jgi:hypothetical protein
MSFIDREVKFNNFNNDSKFKKTEFMVVSNGAHTIRVLQPTVKTVPTHFFKSNNVTVLCLEDECPVCANNKKLIMQFPDNFREQQGYNKVNWRFFINVLDKTPAKTCVKCGRENKDLRQTICTCGEILPEAKPINKVKVLSKGLTLRDDLGSVEKAILDNTGTPIGLMNYDIVLMVTGAGTRDAKVTPVPRTEANEPIPEGLELFDLDKATIVVNAEEMLDIQRGISLKDIFAARKNKAETFEPVASQAEIDDVNAAVDKLFKQ